MQIDLVYRPRLIILHFLRDLEEDQLDKRREDAIEARDWRPRNYMGSVRRNRSYPKTEEEMEDYKTRTIHKIDIDRSAFDNHPTPSYNRGQTIYNPYDTPRV